MKRLLNKFELQKPDFGKVAFTFRIPYFTFQVTPVLCGDHSLLMPFETAANAHDSNVSGERGHLITYYWR